MKTTKRLKLTSLKTVEKIDRLNNSRMGNPRYKFTFTDGDVLKTQSNAGWVYAICPDQLVGRPTLVNYHYTQGGKAIIDGVKWYPAIPVIE